MHKDNGSDRNLFLNSHNAVIKDMWNKAQYIEDVTILRCGKKNSQIFE